MYLPRKGVRQRAVNDLFQPLGSELGFFPERISLVQGGAAMKRKLVAPLSLAAAVGALFFSQDQRSRSVRVGRARRDSGDQRVAAL
jgi:hypothetical protein